MVLPEKYYNIAKWFVGIVLPAISAAVFSLSDVFDIENAEQIMGVCAVLATFLGATLGISSRNYNNSDDRYDGDLVITDSEDGSNFRFVLNATPEELASKDSLAFKKVVEQV